MAVQNPIIHHKDETGMQTSRYQSRCGFSTTFRNRKTMTEILRTASYFSPVAVPVWQLHDLLQDVYSVMRMFKKAVITCNNECK